MKILAMNNTLSLFKKTALFISVFLSLFYSSVTAQVPPNILQQIRDDAALAYPDDYATQEYVINNQTKDFGKVERLSAKLDSRRGRIIVAKARKDHPGDYSVQAYVVENQVAAAQRLGVDVKAPTKSIASLPSAIDLIKRMKRVGLNEELAWRKSKVDDGWIVQLRCYNGKKGERLSLKAASRTSETLNEINCQLTGPSENSVSEVRVEAEVYDQAFETATVDMGVAAINKIFNTPDLNDAFRRGLNKSFSNWVVEKKAHSKGGGYDIVATIKILPSIKKPETYFEGAKKAVKSYVIGEAKAPSSARFHYEAKDVTYLSDQSFSVEGFTDDIEENGGGAIRTLAPWVERHFRCVVKIHQGKWEIVSIEWGKWKRLD